MLFETHAHLSDPKFDSDRDAVIEHAFKEGVSLIAEIADSPTEWDKAATLATRYPGRIFASLGLHPYYASQISGDLIRRLKEKIQEPEVVAIGEIGLDYAKSPEPKTIQRQTFETLAAKSKEWNKPCVIHCREAYLDLSAALKAVFQKPPERKKFWGVIHCFSGSEDDALLCSSLGFALGVDGPVTYPKNDGLRRALARAGADFLVLETDSPYLPPQSRRGKRNEPACLIEIARKLAETLGLPDEEIARKTTENARALYGVGAAAD